MVTREQVEWLLEDAKHGMIDAELLPALREILREKLESLKD